jgi:hypothetical protein
MGMRMLLKPEVRVSVRSMVQRLVVGDLVPVRIVKKKFKFFYIADGFIL